MAHLLALSMVIGGGILIGVVLGRILTARTPAVVEQDASPLEPVFPMRELDAVLAPYEHAA